ncbi:MAG: hypothetical protein WC401_02730 [Bacteroidales bacterium]
MKTFEQWLSEASPAIQELPEPVVRVIFEAGQESVLEEIKSAIEDIESKEHVNLELYERIKKIDKKDNAKTMLYMKAKGLHLAAYRVKQILEKP